MSWLFFLRPTPKHFPECAAECSAIRALTDKLDALGRRLEDSEKQTRDDVRSVRDEIRAYNEIVMKALALDVTPVPRK